MKFSTIEVLELDDADIKHLEAIQERLDNLGNYTEAQIWPEIKDYCVEENLKPKDISNMIRMVMTGKRYHIGTQTILYIMGMEKIKERINWTYTFPNIALEKVEKEIK